MSERIVIGAVRTARWRLAAFFSSALTLGLGLCVLRQALAGRPTEAPSLSVRSVVAPANAALSQEPREIPNSSDPHRAVPLLAALARTNEPREQMNLVAALGETDDEAALDALSQLATRAERTLAQTALLSIAQNRRDPGAGAARAALQ